MNYNFISTRIEEHVFYLTLDREEKRNAFTPTTVQEVQHALQQASLLDEIKLLVLEARGPVFCAGMDLKVFQDRSLDKPNPSLEPVDLSLGEVFDQFNKPSLAILDADVIAGGFLYVLGCQYVFAKKEISFRLPELALGIFPFQVMASLLRIMPEKKVLQLCMDPNPFGLEKAMQYGIVDGLKSDEEIDQFIQSFADKSIFAMEAGIQAIKTIRNLDSKKHYDYLLHCLQALKDRKELKKQIQGSFKKD